ncbi:MAG: hypothetical protein GC161_19240 [Planctomycetaceae bacterium]|nr:hypothetical protein [Planctomycetaceae bacterium]
MERSFGTAQDRRVKELRLAKARTLAQANAVLARVVPDHNRRFALPPRGTADSHRLLGRDFDLASILSVQHERVVSNDYVVRFANRHFQLLQPPWPGLRGGRVVVEERLDGTPAIRFGTRLLRYDELPWGTGLGGSAPEPPEFGASGASAGGTASPGGNRSEEPVKAPRSSGRPPSGGRSGRTPAEPYPPDGPAGDTASGPKRPGKNHPWRKPFKKVK